MKLFNNNNKFIFLNELKKYLMNLNNNKLCGEFE